MCFWIEFKENRTSQVKALTTTLLQMPNHEEHQFYSTDPGTQNQSKGHFFIYTFKDLQKSWITHLSIDVWDNIWLIHNYLKIWNLRKQKNLNIEKIIFKLSS